MQTQGERAAEVLNWMKQQSGGGILTTKQVVDAAQHLIQDDSRIGTILLIMARGPLLEWQPARNNLMPFTPRPSKGFAFCIKPAPDVVVSSLRKQRPGAWHHTCTIALLGLLRPLPVAPQHQRSVCSWSAGIQRDARHDFGSIACHHHATEG